MADTNWTHRIRTWLVVTLITLLVWLYAEGEAVTEQAEQIQVEFVAPPGQKLAIEPAGPTERDSPILVWATFRGSTGQLTQVRQITEQGPLELEVSEQPGSSDDEHVVVMQDALYRSRLGELGVNIIETNPATVTLNVAPLRTVDLPVRLAEHEVQLAGQVNIEPDTVRVTLPARLGERINDHQAWAELDAVDLSELDANVEHTVSAPLRLPDALQSRWTSVEPQQVQVTLTIRKQTETITKERIGVELLVSPVLLRQYSFDVKDEDLNLLDVKLTGPADTLERIQQGQLAISAWVRPSFEQLDNEVGDDSAVVTLPVQFDMPADVTVTSPRPEVPVTVTRKE